MRLIAVLIILGALALPAGASTIAAWTQTDISGHNLTLNYTSSFNVSKNDIIGIIIKNVGNGSTNDAITINEINVSDPSKSDGRWTGNVIIEPDSSKTIDFVLNVSTDGSTELEINIYYNVSSDNKTLNVVAHYPGAPELISRRNNKTDSDATTLAVNISEIVRFNAASNQQINTWNWFKDDVKVVNNYDNLSASWDATGTKTIGVNATNANGTTDTVTWTIIVNSPSAGPAPAITTWSNSKTNDTNLNIIINESETVRFNFTANQTLTSWLWTLNGKGLDNVGDNLTYKFNEDGSYSVGANGSNGNGATQTIVWNVNVLDKESKKKNTTLLSWSPQVVDYVYVNGTINETVEYYITTAESMTVYKWSVDGKPVTGDVDGNTYFHTHIWDNDSIGFHTVIFKGNNSGTEVEFRWYVNVYEIGGYRGGELFDIIDNALESHYTDIKLRMFKYKIAKHGANSAIAARKTNQLHDEIAKRQMTREALRIEYKAGNITIEQYVAALKQAQLDAKYNTLLAKEMANIAKEEMKDKESGKKFDKLLEIESNEDKKRNESKTHKKSKVSDNKQKTGKEDRKDEVSGKKVEKVSDIKNAGDKKEEDSQGKGNDKLTKNNKKENGKSKP